MEEPGNYRKTSHECGPELTAALVPLVNSEFESMDFPAIPVKMIVVAGFMSYLGSFLLLHMIDY